MNYILISITFLFLSCSSKKEATKNTSKKEETQSNYKFENINENDSLFASINKGTCFGQCPVYSMNIYNDGTVIYKGKRFVEKEGEYSLKLNYTELMTFVNKAKSINYMQMDNNYDNASVTDLPSTTTSIVIDKIRKKVYRRFGYPREILAFEKLFSDLLSNENWEKTTTKKD